jgi:hypothetical protein
MNGGLAVRLFRGHILRFWVGNSGRVAGRFLTEKEWACGKALVGNDWKDCIFGGYQCL